MGSSSNIKIKDVAEIAGVSVGTVDRVLHNRGEVASETREKVLRAIKSLDYTPNMIARSLALKKLFRIAALLPEIHSHNDYWDAPLQGVQQAKEELKTYKLEIDTYLFIHSDPCSFEQKALEMIAAKPDGIVFPPLYEDISLKIIEECENNGIPFILIDSNLDTNKKLSFIGQNSFQSGYLVGKLMNQLVGWKEGSILTLMIGEESRISNQVKKRMNGFFEYFKTSASLPDDKLQVRMVETRDPGAIAQQMKDYIRSAGITGIFVPNSRSYLLCEALGPETLANVCIIGYDLLEKNVEWLEKGTINFLIAQNPKFQGYKAVMDLFDYIVLQKEVRKESFIPIDVIMKENYQYYLL